METSNNSSDKSSLSPFFPVHNDNTLYVSVAKKFSNCRYAASETTNFNLEFLQLFDNMNIPNEYLAKTEDIADQVSVKLSVSDCVLHSKFQS